MDTKTVSRPNTQPVLSLQIALQFRFDSLKVPTTIGCRVGLSGDSPNSPLLKLEPSRMIETPANTHEHISGSTHDFVRRKLGLGNSTGDLEAFPLCRRLGRFRLTRRALSVYRSNILLTYLVATSRSSRRKISNHHSKPVVG